jgi:parafibromin
LRSYTIAQKSIEEREGHIVFGEFSWPKAVQTNFRIYGYEDESSPIL